MNSTKVQDQMFHSEEEKAANEMIGRYMRLYTDACEQGRSSNEAYYWAGVITGINMFIIPSETEVDVIVKTIKLVRTVNALTRVSFSIRPFTTIFDSIYKLAGQGGDKK